MAAARTKSLERHRAGHRPRCAADPPARQYRLGRQIRLLPPKAGPWPRPGRSRPISWRTRTPHRTIDRHVGAARACSGRLFQRRDRLCGAGARRRAADAGGHLDARPVPRAGCRVSINGRLSGPDPDWCHRQPSCPAGRRDAGPTIHEEGAEVTHHLLRCGHGWDENGRDVAISRQWLRDIMSRPCPSLTRGTATNTISA